MPKRAPYLRPELTCYGSAEIGLVSPANSNADCLCDCAAASCNLVGSTLTCGTAAGSCTAACGTCTDTSCV